MSNTNTVNSSALPAASRAVDTNASPRQPTLLAGLAKQTESSQSWFSDWCRKQALQHLAKLQFGRLTIREHGQEYHFGDPLASGSLSATIDVLNRNYYQQLICGGSIGAAESYVLGDWQCAELTDLVQIMVRNQTLLDNVESGVLNLLRKPVELVLHWLNRNHKQQAKANISAHYDLGNDFYRLFLDPLMMYSSAVYAEQQQTLAQASEYKLKVVCDKLQLQASDHLLEIGTGWGSLAIYAAQHYGCKVTTTTISEQQYQYAKAQIAAAGLEHQITLLKQDYRDLTGQYDKLVSIEMIEAVGHQYLAQYFRKCSALLKPEGMMVIQAITIAEQRFRQYIGSVDFIRRYIFPGGCLPNVRVMLEHIENETDLNLRDLHDIGLDYARTLADWRDRFEAQLPNVQKLGFNEAFIRLWRFYLCYCEGAFLQRATSTVQIVLSKPQALTAVR